MNILIKKDEEKVVLIVRSEISVQGGGGELTEKRNVQVNISF